MQNLFLRPFSYLIIFLTIISCNNSKKSKEFINEDDIVQSNQIYDGTFQTAGYTITEKTIRDSIKINNRPIFYFSEKSVKIYPDFDFGYFKDSVYNYKIKDHHLVLTSKNEIKDIEFKEEGENSLKLFIDHPYLKFITLWKTSTE